MKKISYTTKQDFECVEYLARCYDFALSLLISMAFNELETSVVYIRDRREAYKRLGVIGLADRAIREADRTRHGIKSVMADEGFFNSYADRVIDTAAPDVASFRNSLANVMRKAGVSDPGFYAQIETTRVLLDACVMDFDSIADDGKRKFGHDRRSDFTEYNVKGVKYWFDKIADRLYAHTDGKGGDINLKTPATSRMFNRIQQKVADGSYIEECMRAAKEENPDFINKITIKEKTA